MTAIHPFRINQLVLILLIIIKSYYIRGRRFHGQDQCKCACCTSEDKESSCCRIESLISVDERGQMVLPKDVRDRANIKAGEKLALISFEKGGEICCLTLIKADNLADQVKGFLGPVMRGVVSE